MPNDPITPPNLPTAGATDGPDESESSTPLVTPAPPKSAPDKVNKFRQEMNKMDKTKPSSTTASPPLKPQTPLAAPTPPQFNPKPAEPSKPPVPPMPEPPKPAPPTPPAPAPAPAPTPAPLTPEPPQPKPESPKSPEAPAQETPQSPAEGPSIEKIEKKNLAVKIILLIVVVGVLAGLILGGIFAYNKWFKPTPEQANQPLLNLPENQSVIPENIIVEDKGKIEIKDTDGDTMTDEWETKYGLNPNDPTDAGKDLDKDKLINKEEFKYETNPNKKDSDSDSFTDSEEIDKGFDANGPGKLKK